MKLLFSISYYSPYVSGLTLYVKRLAEELEKKDFQISVISNRYKPGLKSEEKINGVRVIRAKPILAISKGFLSLDFDMKAYLGCAGQSMNLFLLRWQQQSCLLSQ